MEDYLVESISQYDLKYKVIVDIKTLKNIIKSKSQ